MHLSRRTDFAFRLLVLLGVDLGRPVPVPDAARRLGVSSHHLAKITQELAALGIVETVRGRSGGVRLSDAGMAMSVGEVVRALEPLEVVECFDPATNTCPLAPACRLAPILDAATRAFLAELDRHSVASLCAKPTALRRLLA